MTCLSWTSRQTESVRYMLGVSRQLLMEQCITPGRKDGDTFRKKTDGLPFILFCVKTIENRVARQSSDAFANRSQIPLALLPLLSCHYCRLYTPQYNLRNVPVRDNKKYGHPILKRRCRRATQQELRIVAPLRLSFYRFMLLYWNISEQL